MRESQLRSCLQNSARWRWLKLLFLAASLLPLATGCKMLLLPTQPKEVSLQMEVVPKPQGSRYIVSGTTNLPDDTPITVAAIRYLGAAARQAADRQAADNTTDSASSTSPTRSARDAETTFAVLDYASTTVKQGEWQAELTLQQPGTDGKPWEAWQIEQSRLGLAFQPDESVSFITTLTGMNQLVPLEQQLAEKGFRLPRGMVRSTVEGQRYAEVSQTIALAPPNPGQEPPAAVEPHNYGWGDRYRMLQEPPSTVRLERPADRQTDAPSSPSEFLR